MMIVGSIFLHMFIINYLGNKQIVLQYACFQIYNLSIKIQKYQDKQIIDKNSKKMASQFLRKVLKQIFENQKGFTVQTSVHLKKIDQYLFSNSCPKLTNNDIELLFLGVPEEKIMGLYGLSGIKGTVSGLKKSAHYALQIIYRAITTGKNRDAFSKYFSESDQQDFKLCRLATHITEDKSKIALQLCGLLKDKRPYLSENNYIYSEQAKQKFKKWYKQRPKQKKTQQKKKSTILQPSQLQPISTSMQQTKQSISFKPQISYNDPTNIHTDVTKLQFWDFDVIMTSQEEYLLDTFLDPIDIWQYKKDSKEFRDKTGFKEFMSFLIDSPISQVEPSKIQNRIMSIHMESEEFNPAVLIEKYHKNMDEKERVEIGKQIPHHIGADSQKNLVKYFFGSFLEIEHEIGLIKNNFDQTEKIRNEGNIGFSLRTKTKNSMKNLSSRAQPLQQKYIQCEKLRGLIVFLQQNSDFTKFPTTLVSLIQQNKINQIPTLFNRYQNLLSLYRDKPILRVLIQTIETNMQQARIRQINRVLRDGLDPEQAQILIGLFQDKKTVLRQYIVPKAIYELLIKLQLENKKQLTELQTKIKKYQLINFQEIIAIKKKTVYEELGVEEGDLLEIFINQNKKEDYTYYAECEIFQTTVEKDLSILYQLVTNWQAKYNIFFEQKQLLIRNLIEWSAKITQSIKQSLQSYDMNNFSNKQKNYLKQQKCTKTVCKVLILTQKYIQNRDLDSKIQQLKLSNFQLFCRVLAIETKTNIDFKPCAIKRDFDKNYYNQILVSLIGDILVGCEKIKQYPSFINNPNPKYQQKLYNYVCDCFQIDDIVLGKLPQILTYACVINSIIQDHFMIPFFHQLQNYSGLRLYLQQRTKKKSRKIKQLLYSYIKIQYTSIMNIKQQKFAVDILNAFNQHIFLISEYAYNNYKNLTRFFMESFLNQCEKIVKEKCTKEFIQEMIIIKALTSKIRSKRIDQRWNGIIGKVQMEASEMEKVQNQIFKMKYRNSITFKALFQ